MRKKSPEILSLLLMFFFTLPSLQLVIVAQEGGQEKAKAESSEEKKLRKQKESLAKQDEKRKKDEAKQRDNAATNYRALSDFGEDLYASNVEFKNRVDDEYLDLQWQHASEAHTLNISREKEYLLTENEGEVLKLHRALYDNPRVQEYVNRLGQQIVPDDSDKLYAFRVIVNPIPHATTLSTGTILISTGMISLLDNEAQLAYVLAHEMAHVYKDHWRMKVMLPLAAEEYNKRQQAKRDFWLPIATIMAAGVGQAVAGNGGAIFAVGQASQAVSSYYSKNIALDWNWVQENEADDLALRTTLGKFFDIQEVPRLFAVMSQVAQRDYRTQLGFLGKRSRIKERSEHAQKALEGPLQGQYQEALKANKIKGISPEFNLIMAELKRDNGIHAFYYDMFQLAKSNLQQSVMMRSDDPIAAYYYARVLKQVGRTKEELELAEQSLLKAISLDTRHEIPDVQLHRALMLMDNTDSSSNPEAITALKTYITAYERKRATAVTDQRYLPPNLDVLYGYMRLLGDKTWIAPNMAEVLKSGSGNSTAPTAQPTPAGFPKTEPASPAPAPTKTRNKGRP
jgi:predicted Zn-dependent protease